MKFKTLSAAALLSSLLFGSYSTLSFAEELEPVNDFRLEYPRRALQRGIEGFVEIKYSVDNDGKVVNVEILDSQPAKVFDKAATKAVSRLKYPKGSATSDIVKKIQFKLQ